MTRRDGRRRPGVTLLELMAVIVVLATLAAIAIPTFVSQIRRSRTSEAVLQIGRMWEAAAAYFHAQHATEGGGIIERTFPQSSPVTPAEPPNGSPYEPVAADWDDPTWNALNFSMSSPHRYQYLFYNLADCTPPDGGGAAFDSGGIFGRPGGPFEGFDKMMMLNCLGPNQLIVCHRRPGTGEEQTLRVGTPAVYNAHLRHGDSEGVCPGDQFLEDGFYALAIGDLDDDGRYSFFFRGAFALTGGDIVGMPMHAAEDPLE